ncbi:hypothetical protein PCANC_16450 [Puccinia coronata f. sp. avenae]|uniref:DOC domain-containing protein n=1 Tax=Puccinia coronata f. sp. avenae TaxID=200324 RepID=A0A2N5U6Y4_9BASI|nr:hypothetical protein PCANC_16450 [Puccinia coronata f. sp. avenae]
MQLYLLILFFIGLSRELSGSFSGEKISTELDHSTGDIKGPDGWELVEHSDSESELDDDSSTSTERNKDLNYL